MKKQLFSSGAMWEDIVGYSRAVKTGNVIEVSGTTAVKNNEIVGKGDYYKQSKHILEIIEAVLIEAGATIADVVRTRIYVCDISKWQEVGKAHGEVFKKIKPAATMVEVSRLVDPDLLVEIEATAVITG